MAVTDGNTSFEPSGAPAREGAPAKETTDMAAPHARLELITLTVSLVENPPPMI